MASEPQYLDMPKRGPVVFMFQPTRYVRCETPEELDQWESLMAEKVGIAVKAQRGGDEMRPSRWVETVSVCNGPGFCDCDQEQI